MSLSHEHVGSKIPAKINTYMLTIAELLIHLCYETPCSIIGYYQSPMIFFFSSTSKHHCESVPHFRMTTKGVL